MGVKVQKEFFNVSDMTAEDVEVLRKLILKKFRHVIFISAIVHDHVKNRPFFTFELLLSGLKYLKTQKSKIIVTKFYSSFIFKGRNLKKNYSNMSFYLRKFILFLCYF